MKKPIFIIIALLLIFIKGCNSDDTTTNWDDLAMISEEKFRYVEEMRFHTRIVIDGEVITPYAALDISRSINPWRPTFNPFYTDLILVHNAEEAEGFPDNIILAWPRDNDWTQGLIDGIHWAVNEDEYGLMFQGVPIREPFTLEDFGLTYPITITDLVDNWEKVNALWRAFTLSERNTIRRIASGYARPAVTTTEPAVANIPEEKFIYIRSMGFDTRIVIEGEIIAPYAVLDISRNINPWSPYFNPFYTDLILVHNAEEAEGFPDNIILAWPRDTIQTQILVDGMNWAVSNDEAELLFQGIPTRELFTLEDFGLTYPITATDLVDNWEKVNALWWALTPSERYTIHFFFLVERNIWANDAESAAAN